MARKAQEAFSFATLTGTLFFSGPHLHYHERPNERRSQAGVSVVMSTKKARVLILGGGFAGLYAAMRLDKTLAHHSDVEVTLVNRENFFLFTPMLHEVAASDLDITHIVNPIRKLLRRVKFFHGEVESIDLQSKAVGLFHGPNRHAHELTYDYLIIALGSITNFFNLSGLEEHSLTMKSLGDAIHLLVLPPTGASVKKEADYR